MASSISTEFLCLFENECIFQNTIIVSDVTVAYSMSYEIGFLSFPIKSGIFVYKMLTLENIYKYIMLYEREFLCESDNI